MLNLVIYAPSMNVICEIRLSSKMSLSNLCLLLSKSAVFCIILFSLINTPNMGSKKLLSVEYEIYGRVQGVFFRKYTQQESKKLGLKGWCKNTSSGTVQGIMEGEESKIKNMKRWLQFEGSPSSQIDKAEFSNEKEIVSYSFSQFVIKR